MFLAGLILIPLGAWFERRRRAAGKVPSELRWPRVDLNDPAQRTVAVIVFCLTMLNIVIVSLAAYRGVEYLDSVPFCGQACHAVMTPEFVAHENGPHARVKCVACHVGPGASSFARAKLAGTRRVLAVARGTYARPIVAPVEQLLAARDTCEGCHWPEQLHPDRIRRISEFADDETNTESVTTVSVHVGGGNGRTGTATGIHWQLNVSNEIEFISTDGDRQVIPYVQIKDRTGAVREYLVDGVTPEQLAKGQRRRMDCMDCHNRPSHAIAATPQRAVDAALAGKELATALPFVRREAVKALTGQYPSQDAAFGAIATALREFYRSSYQDLYTSRREDVERAVVATQDLYRRNVFPDMNVTFGTYPNNIGHVDFPGCFRCHDDEHKSKDGKVIGQDCETCHAIE